MNGGFVLALARVVVACVLGLGFSSRESTQEEESESLQPYPSSQSCVWMEYRHRDRPLQYSVGIWMSGEAWYVRFDDFSRIERDGVSYPTILESKSGRFASGEVEALLHLIEERGFFAMESSEPRADMILSEDDLVTVRVCTGEKVHVVRARPPSHISEELLEIVEAIKEKTANLHEDSRTGAFLEAEVLDETRASRLKEKYRFLSFAADELKEHLCVERAILNPGQFVHVGSWDDGEIEKYMGGNSYLFVSALGREFEIRVFLRETGER